MSGNHDISAMLVEQVDRVLSATTDAATLTAFEGGEGWKGDGALEALGLAQALVPEEDGGIGLSWADLGDLFCAFGYHAAPSLRLEEIVGNWACARAGISPPDTPVALAAERLDIRQGLVSGRCRVSSGADHILAVVRGDGTAVLCVLAPPAGRPVRSISRDPRETLMFDGARSVAMSEGETDPDLLFGALALVRAAQIAGALSRILQMSIEYANMRVQFGRPIGKFQAVQHMIAELAAEAAAARAGVQLGLRAMDTREGSLQAVAVAKIRASMAAAKGAALAHQIHGAIGVTEEFMLHHLTRRLWQWQDDAGSEHLWSERLGQMLIPGGGEGLWDSLVKLSGQD